MALASITRVLYTLHGDEVRICAAPWRSGNRDWIRVNYEEGFQDSKTLLDELLLEEYERHLLTRLALARTIREYVWIPSEGQPLTEVFEAVKAARRQQLTPVIICASPGLFPQELYDQFGYSTMARLNPLYYTLERALSYGFEPP